jgi:hypothetical protein
MESDVPMADASEATEDAQPLLGPPELLLVLREAQAQHGLRHGDYARYRRATRAFSHASLS